MHQEHFSDMLTLNASPKGGMRPTNGPADHRLVTSNNELTNLHCHITRTPDDRFWKYLSLLEIDQL